MSNNDHNLPVSLYVHFPWCVHKCPYCDFNSHPLKQELPETLYIDRLLHELEEFDGVLHQRTIQSIFLGGGTPSLFSGAAIEKLLLHINNKQYALPAMEITLEANPGTVDHQHFRDYVKAGVNRLSIGIQSLDDQQLKNIGRIHDAKQAIGALESARDAGFNNINLDVMFGLPKQTQEAALTDLQRVIELDPEHISWYQLTIEPNTYFHQFPPQLPEDDAIWTLQTEGQRLLSHAGYPQYEVSAYAKKNRQCQHNLNYWQFGDYLGIGAGAHSKLTKQGVSQRHWNVKHPKAYMDNSRSLKAGSKMIKPAELVFEFFLNRMRLMESISETEFVTKTGRSFADIKETLDGLINKKLIRMDPALSLTQRGRAMLNEVLLAWL